MGSQSESVPDAPAELREEENTNEVEEQAAAPCSPTPDSRDGVRDMADHDMPPRLVEDPAQLAHVPAPLS